MARCMRLKLEKPHAIPMSPDKLTHKAAEAINAAQSIATRAGHSELQPAHLLLALLEQEGGIAKPVIEKATSPAAFAGLRADVQAWLDRQSKVSGAAGLSLSNEGRHVFSAAED